MEAACPPSLVVAMGQPAHEPENLRLEGPRAIVLLCCTLKGMERREKKNGEGD